MARRQWTEEQKQAAREREKARLAALAPVETMPALELNGPKATGEQIQEIAAVAAPIVADDVEDYLAGLEPEIREMVGDLHLRNIYAAEQEKSRHAKKAAAAQLAQERAARHAKLGAGLISREDAEAAVIRARNRRRVRFTPEMPVDSSGNQFDVGYRVDGNIIFHSLPHECTRGEWESLREQMWRAKQHEMDFEGKGKMSVQRQMALQVSTLAATLGPEQLR